MSSLEDKLNLLPPQVKKEAIDFIDFLIQKYARNTSSQIAESNELHAYDEYWTKLSEKSLEKVWDNPEDEVYNELLKG